MRAPVREVVEKALKLDEHGRAEVVEVLLKSLEVEDLEEETGFMAELDRRGAEMDAGTERGIPWERPVYLCAFGEMWRLDAFRRQEVAA